MIEYTCMIRPIQFIKIISILGLSACNAIKTGGGSSKSCEGNSVQIQVYDTFASRVCGCTEGAGSFSTPGSFTCTVKIGATVYFNFIGINQQHQIITSNASSQVVNPSDAVKVAAIVLNQTGTINVADSGNTNFSGTFTVNPRACN